MKRVLTILMLVIIFIPLSLGIFLNYYYLPFYNLFFADFNNKYSDGVLYKNHKKEIIEDDRCGNGRLWWQLIDDNDIFSIRSQQNIKLLNLSIRDKKFVNNCEKNMMYKASDKSIKKFKKLSEINNYKDISDLSNKIKPSGSPYCLEFQRLVDIALDENGKYLSNQNRIKIANDIINFFNIITNLFGINVINKLIYELVVTTTDGNLNHKDTIAETAFLIVQLGGIQGILLGENSVNREVIIRTYKEGFWCCNSHLCVLFHEIGHALSRYVRLFIDSRKYLNNFDPNIINPSNVYSVVERSRRVHRPSPGNKMIFYEFSPGEALVRYLGRRVRIDDYYYFQQRLAAWSFIQSGYGRAGVRDYGGNEELFAEGFVQWLLTPDEKKALNWEVLNEFYGSELLKIYNVKC